MQNLWPLKQKHSLWFARLFEWIAVHLLFISRLNRLGICANKFVIRLNGLGYPLWKKCSSVQTAWDVHLENLFKKNLSSVQMAWAICSKKLSSLRTAGAICSKKLVINSNGLGYPFKKEIVHHSSNWSYLFKDKF